MKLQERYNLEAIRNLAAETVFDAVGRTLDERPDVCRCEECVLDLAAYVLNRTSPRYATSLLGSLAQNPERERRARVELDLALEAGIRRLREHPHHG